MAAARRGSMFQSLGRDSGCSSLNRIMDGNVSLIVSIPRSGFWVFKQRREEATAAPPRGFNPSVGILGVQAMIMVGLLSVVRRFQSLGRDSGCSSEYSAHPANVQIAVSIPRSGFWVFKPATIAGSWPVSGFQSLGRDSGCSSRNNVTAAYSGQIVSIPRSGFWVFKPIGLSSGGAFVCCFNPSVGILGVQAPLVVFSTSALAGFQSLGRDSGCSSAQLPSALRATLQFQSLGRDSGCSSG